MSRNTVVVAAEVVEAVEVAVEVEEEAAVVDVFDVHDDRYRRQLN